MNAHVERFNRTLQAQFAVEAGQIMEQFFLVIAALDIYWWTKGLAYVAYPIMPKPGNCLWNNLGHTGSPNGDDFLSKPALIGSFDTSPVGGKISYKDLNVCLPESLQIS